MSPQLQAVFGFSPGLEMLEILAGLFQFGTSQRENGCGNPEERSGEEAKD